MAAPVAARALPVNRVPGNGPEKPQDAAAGREMGMARQGDPADLRLVVKFLRSLPDWTQEELSRESGVDRGLISDYELGDKAPTRKTLERLASAVRLPFSHVEALLPLFRAARLARAGERAATASVPGSVADGLDQAILGAVLPRIRPHLLELEAQVIGGRSAPAPQDRQEAGELCESLRGLAPKQRRAAVETEPKYWTWAVAERLCVESEHAAARRADQAAELAKLALRVAELVPGAESWRARLQGYAWAFVANARRVQGDLPGAEEAFAQSDRLWQDGAAADPGVLDGSRPLDLKALPAAAERPLRRGPVPSRSGPFPQPRTRSPGPHPAQESGDLDEEWESRPGDRIPPTGGGAAPRSRGLPVGLACPVQLGAQPLGTCAIHGG